MLNQVFGIQNDVPLTYVNRSNLDERLNYYWNSQKHIVIYGASKQGKTCLRKKNVDENSYIVIQCSPTMSIENLYLSIIRELGGLKTQTSRKKSKTYGEELESSLSAGFLDVLKAFVHGKQLKSKTVETSETIKLPDIADPKIISKLLNYYKKRLIIEDFHYLPESTKEAFAFDLKALYDLGVFVLIVGIWAKNNMLLVYNEELFGRFEEIRVEWSEKELFEVIDKGCNELNIKLPYQLKVEIIRSSFKNVGILQMLMEKICEIEGITEKHGVIRVISNTQSLEKARETLCEKLEERYSNIINIFIGGFKKETQLDLYRHILRVVFECDENMLVEGIPYQTISNKIKSYLKESNKEARSSDIVQALERIKILQNQRSLKIPLITYNEKSKMLLLTDKEFLFYHRYSKSDGLALRQQNSKI